MLGVLVPLGVVVGVVLVLVLLGQMVGGVVTAAPQVVTTTAHHQLGVVEDAAQAAAGAAAEAAHQAAVAAGAATAQAQAQAEGSSAHSRRRRPQLFDVSLHPSSPLLVVVRLHGDGPAAGGLARLRVRVDHPPAALSGALILDAHEAVMQRQVVTDGVL